MARRWLAVLCLALAVLVGCSLAATPRTGPAPPHQPAAQPTAQPTAQPATTPAAVPEAGRPPGSRPAAPLPGTQDWRPTRPARDGQIEGYARPSDGPPGTTVTLLVSTADPALRIRAYRIGAYRGGSGRLVWSSARLPGRLQAAPTMSPAETRTVVAPWQATTTVDTTGWDPGAYLFELSSSTGWQAYTPYFVTSSSARGAVALVAPLATWQAYNQWGGYSLYHAPPGDLRSWAVSFDRPYADAGFGEFMFTVRPVVQVAERQGVPLAYLTDLDLQRDPSALDGALGYVSMGHDEYWSQQMRAVVEQARDRGTNLAFLAANTSYWRVRVEDTDTGPARLVVGYKSDAGQDPMRYTDPRQTTGRFRDEPGADPENRMTGMMYECFPVDAPYRVVTPQWWGFAGTGVRRGTEFPNLVGDEADRVYPVPGTPRPLQVLSSADYSCGGFPTSSQSTYYTAPSGAGVFATGTLRWTCSLLGNCFGRRMTPETVRFVRTVTGNVIRQFARGPVGRRFPAHDNVDEFHLPTVNTVPAS